MEWGGDVNVPSTMFPRPCTRCYAHMGWGGVGMLTFLRPRSLDLAQDVDAAPKMIQLSWFKVGWGGCFLQQFAGILFELFVLTRLLELRILQRFLGFCLNC